jgi:hypothetical protein
MSSSGEFLPGGGRSGPRFVHCNTDCFFVKAKDVSFFAACLQNFEWRNSFLQKIKNAIKTVDNHVLRRPSQAHDRSITANHRLLIFISDTKYVDIAFAYVS